MDMGSVSSSESFHSRFATGVNTSLSSSDLESVITTLHQLSSYTQLDQLVCCLAEAVTQYTGATRCVVLLNNSVQELEVAGVYPPCEVKNSQIFPATALHQVKCDFKPLLISNIDGSDYSDDAYFSVHRPNSFLCLPLINSTNCGASFNNYVGAVYVESDFINVFKDTSIQILTILCTQATILLNNIHKYQELEESLQDLQQLQSQLLERTKQLRISEARFQRVADNIPGVIYQFRLEQDGFMSLPYMSSGCHELFEISAEEVMQDAILLFPKLHPDDRQSYQNSIAISAQTLQPWIWEGRFNLPSGKQKWMQAISRPELQADGSIIWDGVMFDITERKVVEEALRQSEQRLRTVINSAPIILYAIDKDGIFTFSEGQGLETLGLKSSEITEQSVYEFFSNYPDIIEKTKRVLKGEVLSYKTNFEGVFFEIRNTPIQNQAGEIEGLIGVAIDISDRKFAEAALVASLEQIEYQANLLRSVIDATSNWISVKDCNFRYILANRGFASSIGKSFDDILGKHDLEIGFPEELVFGNPNKQISGLRNDDIKVLAGETINNDYDVMKVADGSRRIYDSQKVPLRDREGNIIGIVCIGIDVTERRLEKLQLRESQQFLKLILDTIPLHVYWKDRNSVFLGCNSNFATVAGITSPEEIIGKTDYDLPWEIQEAEYYRECDRVVVNSGKSILGIIESQLQASGNRAWMETSKVPLHDAEGNIMGILSTCQDITLRKNAELALQQVNEKLEQRVEQRTAELRTAKELADSANRAKSEFLANMSHELRTPLNGILGYAQILQRDSSLEPKYKQKIDTIRQCGSHLLTLINDILDLSKIEARKFDLYYSDFDLCSFLDGIVEICQIRAEQKNISFIYENKQVNPVVHTDEKRLRQVLINLLGNAIKFTDKGQVVFKVEVIDTVKTVQPRVTKIRFHIQDTGIGIKAEETGKIFLPFEQVGSKRHSIEGTGLGLAISQRIIHMMGSRIQVTSTLGEGSTFWFDVELACIDGDVNSKLHTSTITGYNGVRRRILVVDDRWDNRSVIVNMLEPLGFECIEASDGQEGLNKALLFQPDLIITDIAMPVLDGLSLTRQLREQQNHIICKGANCSNYIIIVSSASVFNSDRAESLAAGANDFLPKPIDVDELLTQIGRYLHLSWLSTQEETEKTPTQERLSKSPQQKIDISAMFKIPPKQELESLLLSARIGDIEAVEMEAYRIQQLNINYEGFANKLLQFVSEMNEAGILKLVEQAVKENDE